MSQVNIGGGEMIYLAGQVAKATAGKSFKEQTTEILENIDAHLAAAGSRKENILQATILLTDMAGFDEMNSVWDAWVPEGNAPGRACFQSQLNRAGLDVEIIVVATR
jgi:enamine deaminase RidA (YjgF/YER057c/UK114 family)